MTSIYWKWKMKHVISQLPDNITTEVFGTRHTLMRILYDIRENKRWRPYTWRGDSNTIPTAFLLFQGPWHAHKLRCTHQLPKINHQLQFSTFPSHRVPWLRKPGSNRWTFVAVMLTSLVYTLLHIYFRLMATFFDLSLARTLDSLVIISHTVRS